MVERTEDIESMESIIASLLKADADAQAKLREHQQLRQQMADQIGQARDEIQQRSLARAQERIDKIKAQHQAEYEADLKLMDQSCRDSLAELRQNFEAHREEWVETLLKRCLM